MVEVGTLAVACLEPAPHSVRQGSRCRAAPLSSPATFEAKAHPRKAIHISEGAIGGLGMQTRQACVVGGQLVSWCRPQSEHCVSGALVPTVTG